MTQTSAITRHSRSRRLWLGHSARAAMAGSLLALTSKLLAAAENAAPTTPAGTSLAFDAAHSVLLEAHGNTLRRSQDGGRHWASLDVPSAPGASGVRRIRAIAVAAAAGAYYLAVDGLGVLRSEDQGQTWSARNEGLPAVEVAALAAHADRPETIYAYLDAKGIFRSEDGGRRWRLMDAGPRGGMTGFVHSNMPGSMQSGWFFAAGPGGVQRSMDCFCGWRDAGSLGRTVRAVAFDPSAPNEIYAAAAGGLWLSQNGGESWAGLAAPQTNLVALVATSHRAVVAAGSDSALYRREAGGAAWKRFDA